MGLLFNSIGGVAKDIFSYSPKDSVLILALLGAVIAGCIGMAIVAIINKIGQEPQEPVEDINLDTIGTYLLYP